MKISVGEHGTIELTEVYNSVVFKTPEGNELYVCMRDGAFEIGVLDDSVKSIHRKYYKHYYASNKGITPQRNVPLMNKVDCDGVGDNDGFFETGADDD